MCSCLCSFTTSLASVWRDNSIHCSPHAVLATITHANHFELLVNVNLHQLGYKFLTPSLYAKHSPTTLSLWHNNHLDPPKNIPPNRKANPMLDPINLSIFHPPPNVPNEGPYIRLIYAIYQHSILFIICRTTIIKYKECNVTWLLWFLYRWINKIISIWWFDLDPGDSQG